MSEEDEGAGRPGGAAPKRGSRRKSAEPEAGMNAGGLFVRPVQINPDQLIHYIKEQAAEQAAQAARERLNFFFTMMGLFLAIVGAIGVGTLLSLGDRIKADLETTIEQGIENGKTELTGAIDERFKTLSAETASALRDEVSAVILLPLLVSEATSFTTNRASYRWDDRDRILAVMRALEPEILALEGDARIIAMRRIEDILDAFYRVGDYSAALELYDVFGTELLVLDGIHVSMAGIFAAILLHDREFPTAHDEMMDAFLESPHDRTDRGVRKWMEILFITLDMIEGKDDAALATRMAEEEAARPGFLDGFATFLASLRPEFSPDGMNASSYGLANLDRLEGIILEVREAGASSGGVTSEGKTEALPAEDTTGAPSEETATSPAAEAATAPTAEAAPQDEAEVAPAADGTSAPSPSAEPEAATAPQPAVPNADLQSGAAAPAAAD